MSGELPGRFPRLRRLVQEHWGIILITALAAIFRFAYFDLTIYGGDYAYPAYQALQIIEQGVFPTTGQQSSVIFPNPPLMTYIQVLPLLFSRSPLAVQTSITFLNLSAVPLTYLLALRVFDKKTALVASFIYAIDPWAVHFSRATWVQGLLPFFTSLVAYLLLSTLTSSKSNGRRILAALIAASLMIQTYILAYIAIFQIGLVLVAFREKVNWRAVLLGIVFSVFMALPYFALLASQSTEDLPALGELTSGSWTVDLETIAHAFHAVTGAQYPDYFYNDYLQAFPDSRTPFDPMREILIELVGWGLGFLLLLGIGEGVLHLWRRQPAGAHLLLLIWFFAPVVVLGIHPQSLAWAPWYLFLSYPAGFILVGIGARHLWYGSWRWAALALALGLVFLFGEGVARTYSLAAEYPNIGRIEWLPLRYSLTIGQLAKENREVYIKASREWVSAISSTLIEPYQDFEEGRFLVLHTNHPALYVLLDPKQLSPGFAFAQELINKRIDLPNDGAIRLFLFPPRSSEDFASLPSHPFSLLLDSGWRLMGYDLSQQASPGDTLELTTYWLVEDLPPYRERNSLFLKPFAHLLDKNGNALAINDGHGQSGNLWRRGDFYIDTLQMEIPQNLVPGEYSLLIGLYDPNSSRRSLFPNGQDHILIGPVSIQ